MTELAKINSRAPLDRSPKSNWVENSGGLPMYIRRIANHLHQEKGMTIGHAIAVAVNAVKKMCATGDLNWKGKQSANAGSRAEACGAVASWEAKKAGARVSKGVIGRKWTDDEFISFLTNETDIRKEFNPKQPRNPRNGRWISTALYNAVYGDMIPIEQNWHPKKGDIEPYNDEVDGVAMGMKPIRIKHTHPRRKKRKKGEHPVTHDMIPIEKGANPFWDGDGLNGVGQPRDHTGKWVRLPGKSALKKIGVWELDNGSFGVFHDGKQTAAKTFKTKRSAMKDAARKVELDKPNKTLIQSAAHNRAAAALSRGEGYKGAAKELRAGNRQASRSSAKYQAEQTRGQKLAGGFKVGQEVILDPDKVRNKAFKGKRVQILEMRGDNFVVLFPNGDRRLVPKDLIQLIKKNIAVVSKAEFEKLVEEIDTDASGMTVTFDAMGEIEKRDDEKRLVFGWCSVAKHKDGTVEVDKQGDVLEDIDQMETVAYDFVLNSRDGGEMHVRKGVSTLIESFVSTPEKWEAMGIPEGVLPTGWWVGFKVKDDEVWKGVKSGKYKMFSVHGSGTRKALED